jgi:hypothetical protein
MWGLPDIGRRYRLFAHGYFVPLIGLSSFLQSIAADCDSQTTLATIARPERNYVSFTPSLTCPSDVAINDFGTSNRTGKINA